MRGSAAVQVTITQFTVWRLGVASIGIAVTVVWVVWLLKTGVSGVPLIASLVAVSGVVVWLARPLLGVGPVVVRWDGGRWHLGSIGAALDEATPGTLHVHVDLGGWLLLRFVPAATSPGVGASWLPVQRQGSAQDWHALRCALYAPLPVPAPATAESDGPHR